jgi:tetratricopeptide (TPR) repeat protein
MLTILLMGLALGVPVPESLAGLMEHAALQIRQGNYQSAEPLVAEILQRAPQASSAHNLLGLLRLGEGQFDQARQAFADAIRLNPDSTPAHVNLANTLVRLKQDQAAIKEFERALELRPDDKTALFNLGLVLGRNAQFEPATRPLRRAHALDPADASVTVALASAEIGSHHPPQAEPLIRELERRGALKSTIRTSLAMLWLENGEAAKGAALVSNDPERASDYYQTAWRLAQDSSDAGKYARTASILEGIKGLRTPTAEFHDLLGSAYYALDDAKRASDELQDAIQMEPAAPDHYYKLGMVFLKHRTPEPAIYVFKEAVEKRPDVPKLWMGLGLSYYIENQFDEAKKVLYQTIALDPTYAPAYTVMCDMLIQKGDDEEAIKVLTKAIAIQPNLYLLYYYYGRALGHRSEVDTEEVIKMLRKAVELSPDFPEAHFELGKALEAAKRPVEAIGELKKSVLLKPQLEQAHYRLSQLYRESGNTQLAEQELRAFREIRKSGAGDEMVQQLIVSFQGR